MSPKEFRDKMKLIDTTEDVEGGHMSADDILCEVLRDLGYGEGIDIFEAMLKWYA